MRIALNAAGKVAFVACIALLPSRLCAQYPAQHFWSGDLFLNNIVEPNIVYATQNNTDLHLDIYRPRYGARPSPVLMFIHGGGWVWENKEQHNLVILPYLEMGLAVVNVEYRLAQNSPAPAAVEDCRCALHWLIRNADAYHFDKKRIVVAGSSAGGHLALMTGLLHCTDGFDVETQSGTPMMWTGVDRTEPRVAAIINWYGITDVADLLSGDNARDYAIAWIGRRPDGEKLAHDLSPLTYVRPGAPPVLSIQGDRDPIVPYSHSVRLHQALAKAGVPEQLLTMQGCGHGGFPRELYLQAFDTIQAFLVRQHVLGDEAPQGLASRSAGKKALNPNGTARARQGDRPGNGTK